jgi:hypothetical protein
MEDGGEGGGGVAAKGRQKCSRRNKNIKTKTVQLNILLEKT